MAPNGSVGLCKEAAKLYHEACNESIRLAPCLKLSRLTEAIKLYHQALKSVETNNEAASIWKNMAVSYQKLCQATDNSDFKYLCWAANQSVECFLKAITIGNKTLSNTEWLIVVKAKLTSFVESIADSTEFTRREMIEIFRAMAKPFEQFSASEFANFRMDGTAELFFRLADEYFKSSIEMIDEGKNALICETTNQPVIDYTKHIKLKPGFTKAKSELANCQRPLKMAQNFAVSDGIKEMIDELMEKVFLEECAIDSALLRFQADALLDQHVMNSEEVNMDGVYQALDMYRLSVVAAREVDVEAEAITLCRMGKLFTQFKLGDEEKAHQCFFRSVQLATSMLPRNLDREEWYIEAKDAVELHQKEKLAKEEKEWNEKRKPFIEELKVSQSLVSIVVHSSFYFR